MLLLENLNVFVPSCDLLRSHDFLSRRHQVPEVLVYFSLISLFCHCGNTYLSFHFSFLTSLSPFIHFIFALLCLCFKFCLSQYHAYPVPEFLALLDSVTRGHGMGLLSVVRPSVRPWRNFL